MVAPEAVRKAMQYVIDTNKGSAAERLSASGALRDAIREDIGVSG